MGTAAKVVRSIFSVVAISLMIVAAAAAQVRGGAGHAGSIRPITVRPGAGRIGVGTPLNPNFAPIYGVPGLGFSFDSLAAIESAQGRRGFRGRPGQFAAPFLWYSPFYSPYLGYYEEPQPPYAEPQPAQYANQPVAPSEPAPAPESAEPQPPPPEVGQFVLVRLDGKVIFAVAFMAVKGNITYVTREGLRRSFPISELDKEATREMNEANGTEITLPN